MSNRIFSDDDSCLCFFARYLTDVSTDILGTIKDAWKNAWKWTLRKLFAVPWTDVMLVHFFGHQLGHLFMSSFDLSAVVVVTLIMCILCSLYIFEAAKIKWEMWTWAPTSSGLLWENAGDAKPTEAWRELKSLDLARALQEKTTFTELEWGSFGIQHLCMDSFIKPESGIFYFKPAATLKDRVLQVFAVTASGIWSNRAMAAVMFVSFILGFLFEGRQVNSLKGLQQKQQKVM